MIVTIDGPAGAGKSSVAKRLARELGFDFLDTGAMYRCVTLVCIRENLPLDASIRVADIARNIQIEFEGSQVYLQGENVTEAIRTPTITRSIRPIADNTEVRQAMVDAQRKWTQGRNTVTEGRDQGTVAFPNAECKIFLTASPEERARRRVAQLIELGVDVSYEEILEMQNARDTQDTQRVSGGLKPAVDSLTICTDGLNEEQVLRRLVDVVESKRLTMQSKIGNPESHRSEMLSNS